MNNDKSSLEETPTANAATAAAATGESVRFGKFVIDASSIFYRSKSNTTSSSSETNGVNTIAFVNLRPIVPGHVLVIPERIVPRLADLTDAEYTDLWMTVRLVQQQVLQPHYGTTTADNDSNNASTLSFNVAVQDGVAAGQSVPHVHVHILPRRSGDFERNDDVYTQLEEWAPRPSDNNSVKASLDVPDDDKRRDRTKEEMANEATIYRTLLSSM